MVGLFGGRERTVGQSVPTQVGIHRIGASGFFFTLGNVRQHAGLQVSHDLGLTVGQIGVLLWIRDQVI